MASDTPSPASDSTPESTAAQQLGASGTPGQWQTGIGRAVVFGVVAALFMWLLVEVCLPIYKLPPETANMMNIPRKFIKAIQWRQTATSFAIMGAILGLALAAAEGLLRQKGLRWLLAGLVCGILAAGFAVGGGLIGQASMDHYEMVQDINDLDKALRIQLPGLVLLGAGLGLGLGLFFKPTWRGKVTLLVAGLLAGALAAVVFVIGSAVVMSSQPTDVLIPVTWLHRLLWCVAIGAVLAAIIAGIAQPQQRPSQSEE